jgi:hypothetical protein
MTYITKIYDNVKRNTFHDRGMNSYHWDLRGSHKIQEISRNGYPYHVFKYWGGKIIIDLKAEKWRLGDELNFECIDEKSSLYLTSDVNFIIPGLVKDKSVFLERSITTLHFTLLHRDQGLGWYVTITDYSDRREFKEMVFGEP